MGRKGRLSRKELGLFNWQIIFMPEQDKKERALPGETSVSRSSDEYIAGNLGQIQGEINGIDNTVIDGNALAPKLSGSAPAVGDLDGAIRPVFTERFSGYPVSEQTDPNEVGIYALAKRSQIKKKRTT